MKKLSEMTPKARAKRIAQLAANPATRAAIPDKYLPAQYKAGRTYANQKKTPTKLPEVAPGLTQSDLSRQIKAGTALQYGPSERAVQAQAPRITDWYKQFLDAINTAGAQQRTATAGAVSGLANLQSGLDKAAATQWTGQQQAMTADAQQRGATVDPQLADVAHNASNVRGALTGGFGAMLLGQGLNEQNFLANRGVVAKQQGVEALAGNAGKLAELAKQKGEYASTLGDKIISRAEQAANDRSTRALNDYIRKQQLGISKQNLNLQKTKAKTTRHQWSQQTNTTYGISNGAVVQLRKTPEGKARLDALKGKQDKLLHPPKVPKKKDPKEVKPTSGPGSLTPAEEQKRLERVRKISQYFASGVSEQSTDANGKLITTKIAAPRDVVTIKKWLRAQGVDPLAIEIGESLYRNGGDTLGPYGLARAHKYGIHVGGNFRVTKSGPGKRRT